jgi:hypothetical protein
MYGLIETQLKCLTLLKVRNVVYLFCKLLFCFHNGFVWWNEPTVGYILICLCSWIGGIINLEIGGELHLALWIYQV